MKIELRSYTRDAEALIAEAYGICTGVDTIPVGNIPKWVDLGHMSPLEHAKATFTIEDISRACSHQLVRHRLASYSQRSQRYCAETDWEPVTPRSIEHPTRAANFRQAISQAKASYEELRRLGVPDEDARFVLPNATPTKLMMTCNLREWLYIIGLRTEENGAQWEISQLVAEINEQLAAVAPHIFPWTR